jgi:hypothetical protein
MWFHEVRKVDRAFGPLIDALKRTGVLKWKYE